VIISFVDNQPLVPIRAVKASLKGLKAIGTEEARDLPKDKLIQMIDAFIAGESRSRDFVSQMEGEFATTGLDDASVRGRLLP